MYIVETTLVFTQMITFIYTKEYVHKMDLHVKHTHIQKHTECQQSGLALEGNGLKLFCLFKSKLLCKQDAITAVELN